MNNCSTPDNLKAKLKNIFNIIIDNFFIMNICSTPDNLKAPG